MNETMKKEKKEKETNNTTFINFSVKQKQTITQKITRALNEEKLQSIRDLRKQASFSVLDLLVRFS